MNGRLRSPDEEPIIPPESQVEDPAISESELDQTPSHDRDTQQLPVNESGGAASLGDEAEQENSQEDLESPLHAAYMGLRRFVLRKRLNRTVRKHEELKDSDELKRTIGQHAVNHTVKHSPYLDVPTETRSGRRIRGRTETLLQRRQIREINRQRARRIAGTDYVSYKSGEAQLVRGDGGVEPKSIVGKTARQKRREYRNAIEQAYIDGTISRDELERRKEQLKHGTTFDFIDDALTETHGDGYKHTPIKDVRKHDRKVRNADFVKDRATDRLQDARSKRAKKLTRLEQKIEKLRNRLNTDEDNVTDEHELPTEELEDDTIIDLHDDNEAWWDENDMYVGPDDHPSDEAQTQHQETSTNREQVEGTDDNTVHETEVNERRQRSKRGPRYTRVSKVLGLKKTINQELAHIKDGEPELDDDSYNQRKDEIIERHLLAYFGVTDFTELDQKIPREVQDKFFDLITKSEDELEELLQERRARAN